MEQESPDTPEEKEHSSVIYVVTFEFDNESLLQIARDGATKSLTDGLDEFGARLNVTTRKVLDSEVLCLAVACKYPIDTTTGEAVLVQSAAAVYDWFVGMSVLQPDLTYAALKEHQVDDENAGYFTTRSDDVRGLFMGFDEFHKQVTEMLKAPDD